MQETTGMCRFCGQSAMVVVPDDATKEQIIEEATLQCNCKLGNEYREKLEHDSKIEMAITSAQGTTFELFHDDYAEIEEIFNHCMSYLTEKKFKKITIATGEKTKATMSFSNDTFKVEREDKSVCRRETEI